MLTNQSLESLIALGTGRPTAAGPALMRNPGLGSAVEIATLEVVPTQNTVETQVHPFSTVLANLEQTAESDAEIVPESLDSTDQADDQQANDATAEPFKPVTWTTTLVVTNRPAVAEHSGSLTQVAENPPAIDVKPVSVHALHSNPNDSTVENQDLPVPAQLSSAETIVVAELPTPNVVQPTTTPNPIQANAVVIPSQPPPASVPKTNDLLTTIVGSGPHQVEIEAPSNNTIASVDLDRLHVYEANADADAVPRVEVLPAAKERIQVAESQIVAKAPAITLNPESPLVTLTSQAGVTQASPLKQVGKAEGNTTTDSDGQDAARPIKRPSFQSQSIEINQPNKELNPGNQAADPATGRASTMEEPLKMAAPKMVDPESPIDPSDELDAELETEPLPESIPISKSRKMSEGFNWLSTRPELTRVENTYQATGRQQTFLPATQLNQSQPTLQVEPAAQSVPQVPAQPVTGPADAIASATPGHVGQLTQGRLVSQQVSEFMIQDVTMNTTEGSQRMTLHLHPAELGKLTVHVGWESDAVKATIIASEQITSEMLNRDRGWLINNLESNGFDVSSFDVAFGGSDVEQDLAEQFSDDRHPDFKFSPADSVESEKTSTTSQPEGRGSVVNIVA